MLATRNVKVSSYARLGREAGFTLTELMVVVCVLAILSMIAYPSYLDYVKRTSRDAAHGGVQLLAAALERGKINSSTKNYAGLAADGGAPIATLFPSELPLDSEDKMYTLSISVNDAGNEFTITATPIEGTIMEEDGDITLTNTGIKTWNGEAGWK